MRTRFCPILLAIILFVSACGQHSGTAIHATLVVKPGWKKIPDSLITKILTLHYTVRDTGLISQLADIIKPDTALKRSESEESVFNIVSADLDGDGHNEIIGIIGYDAYSPLLCIFKHANGSWYLIYTEVIDTFYDAPTIHVAGNYSANKTFYLYRVYDHGSGVFIKGCSFYKLIDNKVYKCLDIMSDAHVDGWGLYINQSVKSSFDFTGNREDALGVNYIYEFYPGSIYPTDCPWCSHDDIPLIKGDEFVWYDYNPKAHIYKLNIPREPYAFNELNADKIACFGDFGDDSLFVKAYGKQLDTLLKTGNLKQKEIVRKYFSLVGKEKTVTTQKLEVKTKAGRTTFYGPQKNR
jgi:hypothetical protein